MKNKNKKEDTTEKAEPFDQSKGKKVRKFFNKTKKKIFYKNLFLIKMELTNGHHDVLLLHNNRDTFIYRGGKYIIDDDLKYYDLNSGYWALDYHQEICIPIKRNIDAITIKKAVGKTDPDIVSALNPYTLRSFIKSQVIEKAVKGQELDEALKKLLIITLISMVASVGMVILFVIKSGMLEDVNIGI